MSINTTDLSAFLSLVRSGSFTEAAKSLGLSQSALSQKIFKLEAQLQTTLLIRQIKGLKLTKDGEKLFLYAKQMIEAEKEFLSTFAETTHLLSGSYRLASYSSILDSLLIPALAPSLRQHPEIKIDFSVHEVVDLMSILKTDQADLITLDYHAKIPGVSEVIIGHEEFVVIEAKDQKTIPNYYLDHGPHDNATIEYFKFLGFNKKIDRLYLGSVHGILSGVACGLGRAVMSKHLVEGDKRFKILKMKKRYIRPIVLHFFEQQYFPKIHHEIIKVLTQKSSRPKFQKQ